MAFPANPTNGDYYTDEKSVRWQVTIANGAKRWLRAPLSVSAGSGPVTVNNGVVSVDALTTAQSNAANTSNASAAASASTAAAAALAAAQAAQTTADAKVATSALGVSVATLVDGKLAASQIPSITTNDTSVVASEAAMLALNIDTGDVAVRTDLSKSFILRAMPASTLANWQELLSPASPVQSIAGRVGAITLSAADVSGLAAAATSGAYADISGTPRIPKTWITTPDGTATIDDKWVDGNVVYLPVVNAGGNGFDWLQAA